MGRISNTLGNQYFSAFVQRKLEKLDSTTGGEARLAILAEIDDALRVYNAKWSDLAFAAFEYPVMLKRINERRYFSLDR